MPPPPDSPVFISHPHFYNADPVLRDFVLGLSPNEDEHGLFIDIHPVSKTLDASYYLEFRVSCSEDTCI